MNMADVIVPKSDQINADDLIGRDMTITIRDVQIRGGQEQPVSIYFEGSDKAFRPCKSMSRVLVYCWGADARQYIGRSLTLYRDPNVKWGGMAVGGIRISHASHIEKAQTMVLAESKASRKPYTVKPLVTEAANTGLTAEQALAAMEAADSLDALKAAWTRKAMAPFRAELQPDLDRIKARLAGDPFEGPAEEQRGEAHAGIADAIIAEINQRATVPDVNSYVASQKAVLATLDADDRERIAIKQDARVSEIKGDA